MKKIILSIGLASLCAITSMASITKCTGCHGKSFEKEALGKSVIVKDMSKDEIIIAIEGYQNGTYGGPMKGLMVRQVKGLDAYTIANEIKGSDLPIAQPTDITGLKNLNIVIDKAKCKTQLNNISKCIDSVNTALEMEKCITDLKKLSNDMKQISKGGKVKYGCSNH